MRGGALLVSFFIFIVLMDSEVFRSTVYNLEIAVSWRGNLNAGRVLEYSRESGDCSYRGIVFDVVAAARDCL